MPVLRLTDGVKNGPESGPFAMAPESHIFSVTSREAARRILAYDLQNTADPKWSAEILAAFDQGENIIQRDNGLNAYFRVEYTA